MEVEGVCRGGGGVWRWRVWVEVEGGATLATTFSAACGALEQSRT